MTPSLEYSSSAIPENGIPDVPVGEVGPGRLVLSVLFVTLAADWLLYGTVGPGLALSIFAVIVGAVILINRRGWKEDRGLILVAPFALLPVLQAAVASSWLNLLMLFVLLTALAGMRFGMTWAQRWPGWLEALASWAKAPARWWWVTAVLFVRREGADDGGAYARLVRGSKIVLPGLVLFLLFSALLGAGNALAGDLFLRAWRSVEEMVLAFVGISPFRIVFWAVIATATLALCFPSKCGRLLRVCTADWRRHSLSADDGIALWQTWISLAVLNGLFLFVNTLDVSYLWMRTELPPGVGYSSFVHEGVYALIASTVLAGFVLAFFFQQSAKVTGSKIARSLAVVWIGQNLLLLSGVALRLHLYIDAFGWSVLRFHVGSFLVLTGVGFCLLTWYVLRGASFRWLLLANVMAVFCLFYLLQFANVRGWVADWNVERWMAGEGPPLDVEYLEALGAPAWPALLHASEHGSIPGASRAREAVDRTRVAVRSAAADRSWRSWQWRHQQWEKTLLARESEDRSK